MEALDVAAIDVPGMQIRVLAQCTSTNDLLLAEGRADVLLAAEEQTAGRGRRGRRWHSPPGAGVTFSIAKLLRRPLRELGALSLAAGVGAARALRALGASEVALKWPNDLLVGKAKLGGILVQTRGHAEGVFAVVGIGVNCRQAATLGMRLRRPVAALEDYVSVERNGLIGALAQSMLQALALYDARGMEPLRSDWESMHAHAGSRLRVRLTDGRVITGIACGLQSDGALRLQTSAGIRALNGGHVASARPA
jgi:BirA family transcriptional regulator, biotin operon repressor / biotin---[acetyl-CoA-carboxylase] ligase